MEARQAFTGPSISRSFVAIVLVVIALGLGVMGAYVAKSLTGSASAPATHTNSVFAPNTNLRQDNDYPVQPTAAPERALPIRHS